MAESLVFDVVSQLGRLLIQEAVSLGGVRDQIVWVKTQLELLQGFLKDADSRRKRGDARMESWMNAMRGVAYDMEDVIDTIKYMGERRHQRRGCTGSISRYSHNPSELITLHKIRSRIEEIKNNIQSISQSKDTYGIANLGESSAASDESSQSLGQSSPHFDDDDTDVIGLEKDKEKLVSRLLDRNEKTRCAISIVGMGGLGKTTLARKVYKDRAIRGHFDTFGWVSVSQSYRVIELVKDIMKQVMRIEKEKSTKKLRKVRRTVEESANEEVNRGMTIEELEKMSEEEARRNLRDFLIDKRYLVVMDDVWTGDVWREMQRVFPDDGNKGCRILLTTRQMEVANRARSSFILPLRTLNETESSELLCRKAFPPNQHVLAELEPLAQKLAKRCGGLPLALVALGGLLSGKDPDYDAWWSVAQSMNWEDSGEGQECLKILGLSYEDLPYRLKPCFLYIAAYPEDSTISASKLVRLWVAEGFIPQEQRRRMEETGRDWLEQLVGRCMIQVAGRSKAYGRVKRIRIHDLLRDLGISEAGKDGFLHVCIRKDDEAISDGIRSHRAAFHNRTINDRVADSSPHLRTLLGFDLILKDWSAAGRFLKGLDLLRVLDLEDATDLRELPKQIGNMIHLRFLGLRRTGLKRLPSSIGRLLNLQTLDVRDTDIVWLPKSFWKIRTLRHVYIHSFNFLAITIASDHEKLQTLRMSSDSWDPAIMAVIYILIFFGIKFIKNWVATPVFSMEGVEKTLERTHWEVAIKSLEKMDSPVSLVSFSLDWDHLANIIFTWARHLHQLRSLNLEGRLLLPGSSQFPPNLTKLKLTSSELEQDPMPVLEKLPNLRLLEIWSAYQGKSMSCSIGGFPRLRHLVLSRLWDLEEWRVEDGAMPSLFHLTIARCRKLKMLPEGLRHVTSLRELELIETPRAFNDRVRNEFRHIPSIIFEEEKDAEQDYM